MPQEGHSDEEGLVDLFCGDCSFEEEVRADDEYHKDNDCLNNVHMEMVINLIFPPCWHRSTHGQFTKIIIFCMF